jgi:hypothetical protein
LDRISKIFQTVKHRLCSPCTNLRCVRLERIPFWSNTLQEITRTNHTYVEAKGFVDSMHYYERLVDTYNAQKTQPIQMTTSATVADSVTIHVPDEKNRPLLGYSEQLKLAHSRLEDKMQELKRLLQAFLDSSSS